MSYEYIITSSAMSSSGWTKAQQINNATQFYSNMRSYGYSIESICGMLGNIQKESYINPGQQQVGGGGSRTSGYGFIQWTPGSTLVDWCATQGLNWYDGAAQVLRIKYEGEGTHGAGGTWLPTSEYPYSWNEFTQLTDVALATTAYLKERERAGVEDLDTRISYANDWYTYFTGEEPPEPTPPTPGPYDPTQYLQGLLAGIMDSTTKRIMKGGL